MDDEALPPVRYTATVLQFEICLPPTSLQIHTRPCLTVDNSAVSSSKYKKKTACRSSFWCPVPCYSRTVFLKTLRRYGLYGSASPTQQNRYPLIEVCLPVFSLTALWLCCNNFFSLNKKKLYLCTRKPIVRFTERKRIFALFD